MITKVIEQLTDLVSFCECLSSISCGLALQTAFSAEMEAAPLSILTLCCSFRKIQCERKVFRAYYKFCVSDKVLIREKCLEMYGTRLTHKLGRSRYTALISKHLMLKNFHKLS